MIPERSAAVSTKPSLPRTCNVARVLVSSSSSTSRRPRDLVLVRVHSRQPFRSRVPVFRNRNRNRLPALGASGSGGCHGALARRLPYPARRQLQRERLHLPPWPTTTIGSFPQTDAIRTDPGPLARRRAGRRCLSSRPRAGDRRRASPGRRRPGWTCSSTASSSAPTWSSTSPSSSRDSSPPATAGCKATARATCARPSCTVRVRRRGPLTVGWARFAQSLTSHPVKGMLTGPVTILKWSFAREDQPLARTCAEIAAAVREEAIDLERAGIGIIQIDEPALREGLPLRAVERAAYLAWAVACFRLAAGGVTPAAQIHTHMCYAEFADILPAVIALDADVLTIEATRSGLDAIAPFAAASYPNEIGPGIWDIHSPQIPTTEEITARLDQTRAAGLPADRLWVNPDCGLKTRDWQEVAPALHNLVAAARMMRARE